MAKLWAIIRREYLERVRTRWFLIGTLIGPIFFSVMIFMPAYLAKRGGPSTTASDIVVLDATGRAMGQRVADAIHAAVQERAAPGTQAPRPVVRTVDAGAVAPAESLAAHEVMAKRHQGYLIIDARTIAGDSAFYVGRNATSISDMQRVEGAVRQSALAERLEAQGIDPKRVDSLTSKRLQLGTMRLTEKGRGSGESSITFAVSMAFLLYMAIVLYGQAVLRGVLEEKMTRVAEVVISSVKPEILLAGKVIGVGAVGLTQMAIWVIATAYIGMRAAPLLRDSSSAATTAAAAKGGAAAAMASAIPDISLGMIVLILAFFVLGYTFYSSLYGAMGSTVNSEQEAQQALAPVLFLVIFSALMIQPVMMNPSSNLARAASIIPFSAPIIMPMRMSLVTVPPLEVAASVGLLLLSCVAAVWLAGRIYRVGMLMYGKRPGFAEIARWVRAG